MECPRCKSTKFKTENYEGIKVDECLSCHGYWLDEGELIQIINKIEKKFSETIIKTTLSNSFSGIPKVEKDTILPCPKCNKDLKSINYAISSGVVIDRCPSDHGIWFDKGELEKAQAYREHWSNEVKNREPELIDLLEKHEEAHKRNKSLKELDNDSILSSLADFFSKIF